MRRTDRREIVNALRYLIRTGCEWRIPPNDVPPYQNV
ncbi:transposase [Massilia sp.]